MTKHPWQFVVESWRDQELAEFARRAHRQLGRGFVLVDVDDDTPVYVTRLVGAPESLLSAVNGYDPESEALVVCGEADESYSISCVRLVTRH